MHVRPRSIILAACAAIAFTACSDDDPASPVTPDEQQLKVAFRMVQPPTTTTASAAAQPFGHAGLLDHTSYMVVGRDNDTIIVTRAQLVVRDVQIAAASANCPDNAPATGDPNSCPTVHTGPYLVDIAATGSATGELTVNVPKGAYSKMRLSLHKVTSNQEEDRAFREAHPDLVNMSLKLEGTYNGAPFTFTSDLNQKLDVAFPGVVTVGESATMVTIAVDVAPWFSNPSGGLFSPLLAQLPGVLRTTVEANIGASLKAFKDSNSDGQPD